MNAVARPAPLNATPKSPKKFARDASEDLKGRQSDELVVALSGPVGCGLQYVRDAVQAELEERGYRVVPVKVSDLFTQLASQLGTEFAKEKTSSEYFDRVWNLQNLGNALRAQIGDDLGAQVAARYIALDRLTKHPSTGVKDIVPGRVAYIVDQLKNPREVVLLRNIYGNLFYLVGVLCGYERRKSNLTPNMSPDLAERLIERDRQEIDNGPQQLEKTLKLADYFVRNIKNNTDKLREPIKRFIGLIHGENGLTPTAYERGMFAAYSAALRSACLSRQVGAAIMDSSGNVLSTGCNDVPKAGGGLYEPGQDDQRCVRIQGGLCFNDKHKDLLMLEIAKTLKTNDVEPVLADKIASKIRFDTRLKDLIEFSRAVHAEMDALIEAARKGGCGVQGGILFTTTYPCHSCARHIVAAGIRAVYFIEPYGKSLASELHSDAISHEPDAEPSWIDAGQQKTVGFMHFEGVAPTRFATLFYALDSRKDKEGRAIRFPASSSLQRVPEFLDNYRELEGRVAERLEALLPHDDPAANDPLNAA